MKLKKASPETQAPNIIAYGTSVKGDIESAGDFRIEGSITGTVKAKGKIVIGESGSVDGQLFCTNADISGKVKAKLEVLDSMILRANSNFSGDVITKKIAIESGAIFSGNCQMVRNSESEIKKPKE
ncbi:MAG TPA: polymer-forming cytoskeletal protein [Bacteroidales bacterium]